MADGFLSRWSQRKQAQREGAPLAEPKPVLAPKPTAPSSLSSPTSGATNRLAPHSTAAGLPATEHAPAAAQPHAAPAAPQPTLEDVQALLPNDSFARFVAPDVSPEVRNAAMKKLFADPHYNVMDGLDIYIDDYSVASPMPAAMLRQMASAKFLNLFDEDPPAAAVQTPPTAPEVAVAQPAPAQTLPATPPADALPVNTPDAAPFLKDTPHDHPDLRLQPDHAARPQGTERQPE